LFAHVLFQKNETADGIWLPEEGLISSHSDQANST